MEDPVLGKPAVQNETLSLMEAGKLVGLSTRTLIRAGKRGNLQFTRTEGGHRRIAKTNLLAARIIPVGRAARLFGLGYWTFRKAMRHKEKGANGFRKLGLTARRYFSWNDAKALAASIKTRRAGRAVLNGIDEMRAISAMGPATIDSAPDGYGKAFVAVDAITRLADKMTDSRIGAYGLRFSVKRKTPDIEARRMITLLRFAQVIKEGNKTGELRRLWDMIVKDDYPTKDVVGIVMLTRLSS
jgi:excisionase family DNA binding protein